MTIRTIIAAAAVALLWSLCIGGCGSSAPEAKKEVTAPPPPKKAPPTEAVTFQFASIDLGRHAGRIEKADIERFAAVIRKEKIEVLAVEGITRYPGVSTRVDFVDAFAAAAEMRQAFGETANQNGRLGGNAVFSILPIRASNTTHYAETQGAGFESALQSIIDCGVRDVVVVCTRLPDKPDSAVETEALSTFTGFWTTYTNRPILITGNFPRGDVLRPPAAYADGSARDGEVPRLWYTNDGGLNVRGTRVIRTNLGPMFLTQVGVLPPPIP